MEYAKVYDSIEVPRFLSGGGEMGMLTREFDWSLTPVGPTENWPQSLKTTLSIILKSKFPMFLWWGDDLIQFYNDAYRPSLGNEGKHPTALGQRGEDCWPEIWPVIKPLIDQVRTTEESTWSEDQLIPIYRNGKLEDVYWTFSYSPVNDEKGDIAGVLVVCHETTQQVVVANKIKQSEEHFRNLVREATVGIVVLTGEEMKVEIVNEMYGLLIDRTPQELVGKNLFDVIPEAADPFLPMLLSVLSTGQEIRLYDHPYFIYANGEKRGGYVNVVYQPYKNSEGEIIGIMAMCHDVTEQVIARQKIEQAEAKARLAIDSADLGTYEINLLTEEMKTSDRFNSIWGIGRSATRAEFASFIHPEDVIKRQEAHKEAIATGNLHYEARLIWKDGSLHWVKVKGKVLYDENGNAATLLGVIQDVTEQKLFAEQLTEQVKERTLELERSNSDLLQFAHVASHDLKEPARKIKLFNNRILNEFGDILPETGKMYLGKVQGAADRMFSMIDGVLSYSALSSSEQKIEKINLNDTIRSIEADLEILIQQKKALINVGELPQIEGASILVYQLFYNLINNSLKFSKDGEPPVISITASVIIENGKEMAKIVITDNGIGFETEYAERIFNTFTRLHSKDKFEGTGLGLALCKKIAERHSGSITAEGVKNGGAVFTIYLPLKQLKKNI